MKMAISEIVGRAQDVQGKEVTVYRALRSLLCAPCGAEIPEGALFTRRRRAGIRIAPCCPACVSFELRRDTHATSPLIDFLLEAESGTGHPPKTADAAQRAVIAKEVERRLGQALDHCRKRKR